MAIEHAAWAGRQHGLSPLCKLILIRIAEGYADCDGRFPLRVAELARYCSVTPDRVGSALEDLADAGLLRSDAGRWQLALEARS